MRSLIICFFPTLISFYFIIFLLCGERERCLSQSICNKCFNTKRIKIRQWNDKDLAFIGQYCTLAHRLTLRLLNWFLISGKPNWKQYTQKRMKCAYNTPELPALFMVIIFYISSQKMPINKSIASILELLNCLIGRDQICEIKYSFNFN